jgi:hypothetical protein
MSEKKKVLVSGDASLRDARRQRLCKHLHAAGPRPVLEALLAVDCGQPLDDVLEQYVRIPSSIFTILGASRPDTRHH